MILLIDNYDSFVFNIEQFVKELSDEEVLCVRNDAITISEIQKLKPNFIILSPGPKHPADSGVCLDILAANLDIPIWAFVWVIKQLLIAMVAKSQL